MAAKPGSTTTTTTMMTTTTFLAVMSVLVVVLAVLVRGEVTQKEDGTLSSVASTSSPSSSSSSSSSSSPAAVAAATPAVAAAAEDYEPTDVNASSTSEARGVPPAPAGLPRPGSGDVGCRGLRSKRYISDGFCRTLKPISEVLCTGYCVPDRYMPWYPEFMQIWGRAKVMEYRCVDGVVRNQKIRLMCDNGKMRVYKVRVVKSCACRKHVRPPSLSLQPSLNQPHQLPSSASNVSALAAEDGARAGAGKVPSKKHNRQRHHGKKRTTVPAEKNA